MFLPFFFISTTFCHALTQLALVNPADTWCKDIEMLLEMDSWDFFLLFETEIFPKSKEFGYFMI